MRRRSLTAANFFFGLSFFTMVGLVSCRTAAPQKTAPNLKKNVERVRSEEAPAPPVVMSSNCEGPVQDGQKTGLWKCKNPEGQVSAEMHFEYGLKQGSVKIWGPNGQLDSESEWQKGRLIGLMRTYFPNNQIHIEAHHDSHQRLDGDFNEWNSVGRHLTEAHYKNGILDGIYREWNADGSLIERCTYVQGVPQKDCSDASRDKTAPLGHGEPLD